LSTVHNNYQNRLPQLYGSGSY